MKIALVQQHATADSAENRTRGLRALEDAAAKGADIVCFAELAFDPFHPQRRASGPVQGLAETVPGPLTEAFGQAARELGVVVVLNLFERDGERTYDTSPVIDADGRLLGRTRMVHITDYEHFHETDWYDQPSDEPRVFDTRAGRIGVAICYDRHYPELTRALAVRGAEVIVVPQAGAVGEWPEGLFEAEMRVVAFQNGCFVALCNRVGKEEHLEFAGESFVCDPAGRVVARAGTGTDEVLLADLDLSEVEGSHGRRLFLRDRRPELYPLWLDSEPERPA